jgi:DNA-binding CsgD family transcriptional regulator
VARTRRRHAEIHDLLAQGHNQTQICQILGLSEHTVRKFRRAATWRYKLSLRTGIA